MPLVARAMIIFVLCVVGAVVLARAGGRRWRRGSLDGALVAAGASAGLMGVALFALTVGVWSWP